MTSYHDAVDVLRDPGRFTVEDERFSTGRVVGPSMLSTDGEAHSLNRRPFEPMFRARAVSDAAERVTGTVDRLIDGFQSDRTVELRARFAAPLAVKVIADHIGLTSVDDEPGSAVEERLLGYYRQIVAAVSNLTADTPVPPAAEQAVRDLNELIVDSCVPQPEEPGAPAGALAPIWHAGSLSKNRILSNTAVILFGAIETSESMTANALFHLLGSDDLSIVKRRQEHSTAFCRHVVTESLRMEPAAAVVDRYATTSVDLGGAHVDEGDLVVVSLAGANRDPLVFDDPDTFDPYRANADRNLAFARGPHACIGIHLARLQTVVALRRILERLPGLSLAESSSTGPQGLIFRKPTAVVGTW